MSWYTLASVADDEGRLTARFVPAAFVEDLDRPVLVVILVEPADRATALETFGRFRETFVVDYSLTATSFTALVDPDWEEWTVHAAAVEHSLEPYTAGELLDIAKFLSASLQREGSDKFAKMRKIDSIEHFVRDLIARAEAKKSLGSKAVGALDSQLDVLTRVLNRIVDRESGS
jgi:hypothetical protein